jgi:hypothetical protein
MGLVAMVVKPEHAADPNSTPEHWRCVDCDWNTAPGIAGRAALMAGVAGGVLSLHTDNQELYSVHDKVWRKAGNPRGCLCIGCLEARLGRYLKPKDFEPDGPFNFPGIPASKRLRHRRGY